MPPTKALTRPDLFDEFTKRMTAEREYQTAKWGDEFDKKNTPNDWVAYIVSHLGLAVTMPWDAELFGKALVKVATLCAAAHEWLWRTEGNMPKRHYDEPAADFDPDAPTRPRPEAGEWLADETGPRDQTEYDLENFLVCEARWVAREQARRIRPQGWTPPPTRNTLTQGPGYEDRGGQ